MAMMAWISRVCGGRVFLLNSNTSTIRSRKKATNLLVSLLPSLLSHSLPQLSHCSKTTIFLPHVNPTFSIYMPMASRFLSSRHLPKALAALAVFPTAYLCVKNKNNTYAITRPLNAPKNDHPQFSVFLPWHMLYRLYQTKERHFVQQLLDHIDMRETEDNLLLRLHLLQLDREDVKIYVDHKTLTIKEANGGSISLTIKDANGGRIFGIFRDRSRFTCTLELTEQYCKYPITAKMEKGMLEVVVPKMNNEEGMLKVVLQEGETIDVKVE